MTVELAGRMRLGDTVLRADFRGDLRSSLLAAPQHDAGASESELALAHAAGRSRAQVRQALANLELTGPVRRAGAGGGR